MKMYITSDSWPFYVQPDGSLTDTPDPAMSDLGWDSVEQMMEWDEDAREATLTERKWAAKCRYNAKLAVQLGLE